MKQTLCFLQKFYWQYVGVFAAFALIIMWGCWFTRESDTYNLFYTYYGMFPFFVIMMPPVFGMGMRYYFELCISFGAIRKTTFWALQVLSFASFLLMLAICIGLNVFADVMLPTREIWGTMLFSQPTILFVGSLLGLCLMEGGLCLARVKQTKLMAVLCGAMFAIACGFIGAASVGMSNATNLVVFDASKLWYWVVCAVLAVAMVGLFGLSHRMYQKATVSA